MARLSWSTANRAGWDQHMQGKSPLRQEKVSAFRGTNAGMRTVQ